MLRTFVFSGICNKQIDSVIQYDLIRLFAMVRGGAVAQIITKQWRAKMKNLKKRLRKRTIEAYTCACGTPQDCMDYCSGSVEASMIGAQYYATQLATAKK